MTTHQERMERLLAWILTVSLILGTSALLMHLLRV